MSGKFSAGKIYCILRWENITFWRILHRKRQQMANRYCQSMFRCVLVVHSIGCKYIRCYMHRYIVATRCISRNYMICLNMNHWYNKTIFECVRACVCVLVYLYWMCLPKLKWLKENSSGKIDFTFADVRSFFVVPPFSVHSLDVVRSMLYVLRLCIRLNVHFVLAQHQQINKQKTKQTKLHFIQLSV